MRKIGQSKKGTTMVEVLIAFLVVMLMMGMFSKVVAASVHLLQRSREIIERTEDFNKEYLTVIAQNNRSSLGTVELVPDRAKTKPENSVSDIRLKLKKGQLELYVSPENGMKRYSFSITDAQSTQS